MKEISNIFKATILSVVCMLVTLAVQAENGPLHITVQDFTHKGDSLYLTMTIDAHEVNLKSQQALSVKPVITDGENERILSSIELKGAESYRVYRRQLALMSQKQLAKYRVSAPYAVMKVNSDSKNLVYSAVLPYEDWMVNAYLEARNDECGCGGSIEGLNGGILAEHINEFEKRYFVNSNPALALIKPEVEEIKERMEEVECLLYFEVNKCEIKQDYLRNPQELRKIRNMIDLLCNDNSVTVGEIKIIGFASPEGPLTQNKTLSTTRAEALKKYLVDNTDLGTEKFSVSYGGENWAGLRSAIKRSELNYKNEVLDILDSNISTEEMKVKLKGVDGGKSYSTMVKDIYSRLRIAKCEATYRVRNYTLDEIKRVMNENPKNLSLNEMYLLANTYTPGSKEYVEVFDLAVRMFPKDVTANINAAVCALMNRDLVGAEFYLNQVKVRKRIPEYDNCKGVLEALKGNKEEAENFFKGAAEAGLQEAEDNLKQMNL